MGVRRKRMHGKRRRKSSCTPFKQIEEAKVNADRSYMNSDYTGVRTDAQALEYMRSLGDQYGYTPSDYEAKDDSYKDLPVFGHDEDLDASEPSTKQAPQVQQQPVSKKQKAEDVLGPPPDLKLDTTQEAFSTGTKHQLDYNQVKTKVTNEIIGGNISKSRKENPEYWAQWDADKAERDAQKSKDAWENRINALQIGLSVGGVGFPPLDVLNAVISGGRTLHAGLTGDWKSAGEHFIATGANVAAVIPGAGDSLGIGINTTRAAKAFREQAKAATKSKTWVTGARRIGGELVGYGGPTRMIGQGIYWGGTEIPGTDFSLGSGTIPSMWDMLSRDDDEGRVPEESGGGRMRRYSTR